MPNGEGTDASPYEVIAGVNAVTLDANGEAVLLFMRDGGMHTLGIGQGITVTGDVINVNGAHYVGGATKYTDGEYDSQMNRVLLRLKGEANAACKVEITGSISSVTGIDKDTATGITFGSSVYAASYTESALYATFGPVPVTTPAQTLHVSNPNVKITLYEKTSQTVNGNTETVVGTKISESVNGELTFSVTANQSVYFVFESAEEQVDFVIWFTAAE